MVEATLRPRLLDLYCGAGGASMGYHLAGFDVVGVDHRPQPNYPFTFLQCDALEVDLSHFHAIHASPPCQRFSRASGFHNSWNDHPDLVAPTRARLQDAGVPYVMENVVGAPLVNYVVLCGSSFGLGVIRHRLFETSFMVWNPPGCVPGHPGFTASVFGNSGHRSRKNTGSAFPGTMFHVPKDEAERAMGIGWMSKKELSEAIPPAYTHWLGTELMHHMEWEGTWTT